MHYLLIAAALTAPAVAHQPVEKTAWNLKGDLSESCSCSVPCSCNFGEQPSPHHFCYALFSLDVKEGKYGDTDLSGLRLAGALGAKGFVWYIDSRANKEQAAAFKAIATKMGTSALKANGITDPKKAPPEMRLRGFRTVKIEQIVGPKSNMLKIGKYGSFASSYIVGMDGKTPVRVENNTSWNIQNGMKGKSKVLTYHDEFGNSYTFKGTNANQGTFDWSDTTPVYFR